MNGILKSAYYNTAKTTPSSSNAGQHKPVDKDKGMSKALMAGTGGLALGGLLGGYKGYKTQNKQSRQQISKFRNKWKDAKEQIQNLKQDGKMGSTGVSDRTGGFFHAMESAWGGDDY